MSLPSTPNTLNNIITKVRRVTARPSPNQISDAEICRYVNTFYLYDMPEHLKMESLRYNYQFMTTANIPAYDMPTDTYLTAMPPVFIGGYQSYMTQSRQNFFRINPSLNYLQQSIDTGTGSATGYSGTLTQTPILPGFKPNPPGAYAATTAVAAKFLNWNVMITAQGSANGTSGIAPWYSLIDDGQGHLFDPSDADLSTPRGTVNYLTGAIAVTGAGFVGVIPSGNPINAQYVPYVASRPQSVVMFQDQFLLYPIPDQAYSVSFEAYRYPLQFTITQTTVDGKTVETVDGSLRPQLNEWWQMLAYGAADKIFADNADFENMQKFRPLLDEQMRLCLRRTLVQQTSERTATIYTEQSAFPGYPFGNVFSGF